MRTPNARARRRSFDGRRAARTGQLKAERPVSCRKLRRLIASMADQQSTRSALNGQRHEPRPADRTIHGARAHVRQVVPRLLPAVVD